MGLQKRLVGRRNRGRLGERTRIMVDGPSADHDLVLRARLPTQAPEIDASVYLTECDPSSYAAGDLVEVEIAGARDYDLITRPIGVL
jgi:ribosomal protein S12 methylthiotransferase